MRGRAAQQIIAAVKLTPADAEQIAGAIYSAKEDAYAGTLEELANHHGYELPGTITLSSEIEDALYSESVLTANRIVSTHNSDVAAFVATLPDDLTPEQALEAVDKWQTDRADYKAQVIAVDQVYDAHADATLHFYSTLGVEPMFDFGGHGDPDPECELCKAVKARNPHPIDRVLEIGSPHNQCAQEWHAKDVPGEQLPQTATFGTGQPMGIVGQDPLLQRFRNRRADAVRAIAQMP